MCAYLHPPSACGRARERHLAANPESRPGRLQSQGAKRGSLAERPRRLPRRRPPRRRLPRRGREPRDAADAEPREESFELTRVRWA